MTERYLHSTVAIGLGVMLTTLVLWLGGVGAAQADPGTRYVAPGGVDGGNDCQTPGSPCATLQRAIDVAGPGDEVHVAGGLYSRAGTLAAITKALTIRGGYAPGFGQHEPDAYPSVLDAQSKGPVIRVTYSGDVRLEFLQLQHGDGSAVCDSTLGCGGGVYARSTNLVIDHCVVWSNTATRAPSGWGWGGGIYVQNDGHDYSLEIQHSAVLSNVANADVCIHPACGSARGGGVYARGGQVAMRFNLIAGNVGHLAWAGAGGGLYVSYADRVDVVGNVVARNRASLSNWRSDGGGIWVDHSDVVLLSDNQVEDNMTSGHPTQGAGLGGGMYVWDSDAQVYRNLIRNNSAGTRVGAMRPGGGVCVQSTLPVTLADNLIVHNSAGSYDGGGVSVGLSWAPGSHAVLVNNTIAANGQSSVVGWQYAVLTLTNNIIAGHDVGLAAVAPQTGSAVVADTNLFSNTLNPVTGTHALFGDPRFGPDYRLQYDSPAVDAGLTVPWLENDLAGVPRPQGRAYDLGAFESLWPYLYLPVVVRH